MTTKTGEQDGDFSFIIRPFQGDCDSRNCAEALALMSLIFELQDYEHTLEKRMVPADTLDVLEYVQRLRDVCCEHQGRIWVAEQHISPGRSRLEEPLLVGYAVVLTQESSREDDYEVPYRYGMITDFMVHKDYRRRGIGRALMKACQEFLGDDVHYLRIEVLSKNTEAVQTYRRLGFQNHLLIMEQRLTARRNDSTVENARDLPKTVDSIRTTSQRSWQDTLRWCMVDILVNVLVLNLSAEFVKNIVIEPFSTSILLSTILALPSCCMFWFNNRIYGDLAYERRTRREMKILRGYVPFLVSLAFTVLILCLHDSVVHGSQVELGDTLDLISLAIVLQLSGHLASFVWQWLDTCDPPLQKRKAE